MDIKDFYDIAEYASNAWNGKFSPRELCEFAYDYYLEYKSGMVVDGSPLCSLITQLVEEYDVADDDTATMIGNWLEDMSWQFGYTSYNGYERFLSEFR